MKKLLTLFTGLLLCLHMTAAQRSLEEAQQVASQYFTSHSNVLRAPSRGATMQHSWTELTDQGTPAFYVFNRGTDDGFVIVSAESRTRTIIGYSDKGHLDQNDMPVNMRTWLEGYKPFIQQVAALPERPTPILGVPTRRATKSYTPISPICTTTWGQRQPYNLNCPLDSDGEACVTGCVATAAAQIMKVHQHPTQGIGSFSYEWTRSDGSTQTLSSNYASHTYDWAHMKDDYQNSSSTTTEQNAVALLMSDCGIACEMDYSSNESSAYFKKMMLAMVNHFGYDPAIRTIVLDYMSEEAFVDAIYVDLQAGRPVYFSGRTINDEGHAFVGDGLDADGLVHINWGWNGSSDGYFRVSLMDPEDQGTGGSSGNYAYTEGVAAYTNIKPNENGAPAYFITSENITVEETRIANYESFHFKIDTFYNQSISDLGTSYIGFLVYQNGVPVDTIITSTFAGNLPSYYFYYYCHAYPSFYSLEAGSYEIVPIAALNADGTAYTPIMQKWVGEFRCAMTVTDDSIFLTLPQIIEPDKPEIDYADPSQYAYTGVSAYYYPSYSEADAYWWQIQIETAGFWQEEADPDEEAMLMFYVYSSADNSFLGSFVSDEQQTYTCVRAYLLAGTTYNYNDVKLSDPELTVVYNSATNRYQLLYQAMIGNKICVDTLEFAASYIRSRLTNVDPDTGKKSYENIELTTDIYTTVTPTWATAELDRHADYWASPIPYAVGGTLSQLKNTPAQIQQYKNCRLYISDGVTELYSHNTKWLNNTDFTTGYEIEQGGKGVIVGTLKNFVSNSSTTKELINCYFVQYEAPTGFEQTTDDKTSVQKVVRNGQILILRNGKTYTMQGAIVND